MLARLRSSWAALDPSRRRWVRAAIGAGVGAAGGFAYYTIVGCSTGACPITSDPVISSLWGAVIGGFAAHG